VIAAAISAGRVPHQGQPSGRNGEWSRKQKQAIQQYASCMDVDSPPRSNRREEKRDRRSSSTPKANHKSKGSVDTLNKHGVMVPAKFEDICGVKHRRDRPDRPFYWGLKACRQCGGDHWEDEHSPMQRQWEKFAPRSQEKRDKYVARGGPNVNFAAHSAAIDDTASDASSIVGEITPRNIATATQYPQVPRFQ